MRRNAKFIADRRNAGRAEEVNFNGRIERRIETHGCGRVDDDVATGENGAAGVIEVGSSVQAVFGTQAEALKNDIVDVL